MIKNKLLTKGINFAVIVLFIGMSIPSTGHKASFDDNTPPVTTCTLDPPEPDGDNGWYVSDVTVRLIATDNMSGVKEIRYKIGTGSWQTIHGGCGCFVIDVDGKNLLIEYYAVDYAGNEETHHTFTINMDQTIPDIQEVQWETYKDGGIWYVRFTCNATDETSGMDRVEMYIADTHYETIEGRGPIYEFEIMWSTSFEDIYFWFYHYDEAGNMDKDGVYSGPSYKSSVTGLICNPKVINQSVTFFAIIVLYTFPCGCITKSVISVFKHFTIPKDYTGYIGRFFICVSFDE